MGRKGEVLKKLLRLGVNDADVLEKVMSAKDDEDSGWRTINGSKVHFEDNGKGSGGSRIDKGPAKFKGKTVTQINKEARAQTKARGGTPKGAKPAAPKSAKAANPAGKSTGTSPWESARKNFLKGHPGARTVPSGSLHGSGGEPVVVGPSEREKQLFGGPSSPYYGPGSPEWEKPKYPQYKPGETVKLPDGSKVNLSEFNLSKEDWGRVDPDADRAKLEALLSKGNEKLMKKYGFKPLSKEQIKEVEKQIEQNIKNAEARGLRWDPTRGEYDPRDDLYDGRGQYRGSASGSWKTANASVAGYNAPTKLSPSFERKSAAKRDTKLEKDFAASTGSVESIKQSLDAMKPGTVLRYNERGYSLYTKQKDGSWTYQNAKSDQISKTDPDTIAADIMAYQDPKTKKSDPAHAIQGISTPKKGEGKRSAEWDARRALANLEPNPGDAYEGRKTSLAEAQKHGEERANGKGFPKEKGNASAEYSTVAKDGSRAGVPVGKLEKGSGVTKISRDDIAKPNPDGKVYNTLAEHCMEDKNGNLVLTPEREKLHQAIMEETFANAEPAPKDKKVFTMLGGGSAAGKGTIQKMMPDLFNQNSPVIDADEMKKRIPEYTDCAFSADHNEAASLAHEESSALAKRAMQTAFANGYNCTLDGTGDGSLDSMKKKIEEAQKAGYSVEGVYVTCPTDLAVERSNGRSKTDEYNRLVKEETVRDIHSKVSNIFPKIAPLMDHVVLYDTNQPEGEKPKIIAECWKGQKIKVHDKKAYRAFLKKDLEPKNKKKSKKTK